MQIEQDEPPADLGQAGAIVDKAIQYMSGQNIAAMSIASALLGGALAVLSQILDDAAVVSILNNAIASVKSGELQK